jgi:hypothetical protein
MTTAIELHQELRDLQMQKKVIEAKFDKLKKEAIDKFLVEQEELIAPSGLVLITYKSSTVERFQQAIFKQERNQDYRDYCVEVVERRFLIK